MQYNYYSPWSVSNDAASGFLVRAIVRDSGTHVSVTSSEQAFEFLSQFCQQKKIQEQCLMGLATSLMFPTHNLTGVPVRLVSAESPLWQMEVSDDEKDADMKASFELLPYLMTISLHGLVPVLTISTPSENKQISRSQEALLLYLFEPLWSHECPISPWRPIGTIDLQDAMIQVQIHSKCGSRYFLKCKHWS
ncbi:hypothetical protein ACO22_00947 [Paracoccidioides brasiliensis]|uniref:Uncharacterized protein n=1 Tax=Paracoccidioides brasiliensis TaxID=121759 RepID=A0A1D2JMW0_PARBR|nr:hypothetical protein ACO22_00947 [Paracoccidioides brasiliensis]